jgi:hypothetical protein
MSILLDITLASSLLALLVGTYNTFRKPKIIESHVTHHTEKHTETVRELPQVVETIVKEVPQIIERHTETVVRHVPHRGHPECAKCGKSVARCNEQTDGSLVCINCKR